MTVNMLLFIIFVPMTIFLWLMFYFFCFRKIKQEQRCSQKTIGSVIRYSMLQSSPVALPVVEYYVEGKEYKTVGPKFSSYYSFVKKTPFNKSVSRIESNLTTIDDLPKKLKVKIYKNSFVSVTQSPLVELFPIGTKVDVYYNPNKPKQSFVIRSEGCAKFVFILLLGMALVSTLTLVLCLVLPTYPM